MKTEAEDLAALSLPGSIPGLLRRGSPCFLALSADSPAYWLAGRACTVHAIREDIAACAVDDLETVVHVALSALALDLTDPTGRAHAEQWLAMEHGSGGGDGLDGHCRFDWRQGRWTWSRPGISDTGRPWYLCPALDLDLADLDIDDPRTLPDGRRYVDVLALVLVCEHVARVTHG